MSKLYRLPFLFALLFLLGSWQAQAQSVFINEIHYDNDGTDTGEGVEIAGPVGTELSGWSVVLYNGNGGAQYSTTDLSGTLPETGSAGGFGFLWVSIAGIQNGAPDAIALVNATGEVVQFLSYEGSLTATDGPASGMSAEDIGVSQSGTDAVGESLQLSGDGNLYTDFSWNSAAAHTMGAINTNQTFNGATAEPVAPTVADIATIRTLPQGTKVQFAATLTAVNEFGGPAYLQDATGGIALYDEQIHANAALSIGDSLTVTGSLGSFNDMLQIVDVTDFTAHGPATYPVVPTLINLDQLAAYEGQLVTLENINFTSGTVFAGNTNYAITDGTHTGDLRIDNDVASLIGLGVPKTAVSATGVIGSFRGAMQLMPRFAEDLPAAAPYEYPYSDVSFATTLDIASWNMEFFGATQSDFGPNDEATQQANALKVLQNLNADIIAVQEISDEAALQAIVTQLGANYAISCSDKYSFSYNGPDPDFPPQKLCFIYNTDVVKVLDSRVMFDEFYTEVRTTGNTTLLPNYPTSVSQFWSGGRLPYMLHVQTTVEGQSEEIYLINVHGKAGDSSSDYNRRQYDMQVVKDSLDAHYPYEQVVILGDYNDDLDQSIAAGMSSPYQMLVESTAYLAVSKSLSDAGNSSYLFSDGMIDHIILSNDLQEEYLSGSVSLFYAFNLVEDYAYTTSDHLPVRIRLQPATEPAIAPLVASIEGGSHVFNGYAPEACTELTASAEGGKGAYTYLWNSGETTATIKVCPTETQNYSVTVSDEYGNSDTYEFTICVTQVDCSRTLNKPKVIVSKAVGATEFDLCLPADLVPYVLDRGFLLGSANDVKCANDQNSRLAKTSGASSYRFVDVENLISIEADMLHYLPLEEGSVEIKLYDLNGQLKQTVYKGGSYFAETISARLNTQHSGLYLLQFTTASGFSKTIKIQR